MFYLFSLTYFPHVILAVAGAFVYRNPGNCQQMFDNIPMEAIKRLFIFTSGENFSATGYCDFRPEKPQ